MNCEIHFLRGLYLTLWLSMALCLCAGEPGYPVQEVDSAGEVHGLRIRLFTEQYDYSKLTDSAGFKVVLHDQNKPPDVDNFGISVPPGFRTTLAVQRQEVMSFERRGEGFDSAEPHPLVAIQEGFDPRHPCITK